jgi:hypothetical protein
MEKENMLYAPATLAYGTDMNKLVQISEQGRWNGVARNKSREY